MDKKTLRKRYIAQRMAIEEVDWQKRSQKICDHLYEFCFKFDKVSQVFFFHPMRKEPNILKLASKLSEHYKLALPRISNKEMLFHHWNIETSLLKHSFSIEEPHESSEILKADEHTLVLVPNLAMDTYGYRLGYGAGFYDKFLSEYPQVISVAVNFSEFLVDELPRDSWDKKVQWMCTELGVTKP